MSKNVLAIIFVLFTGCGILKLREAEKTDLKAEPPGDSGGYLKAGPVTEVEEGPAQKTLLKEYVDTKKELEETKRKLEKLRNELQTLRKEHEKKLKELQKEKYARKAAEAERDKAFRSLRERDIQLLDLALEKARIEKDLIKERIKAMKALISRNREKEDEKGKK